MTRTLLPSQASITLHVQPSLSGSTSYHSEVDLDIRFTYKYMCTHDLVARLGEADLIHSLSSQQFEFCMRVGSWAEPDLHEKRNVFRGDRATPN